MAANISPTSAVYATAEKKNDASTKKPKPVKEEASKAQTLSTKAIVEGPPTLKDMVNKSTNSSEKVAKGLKTGAGKLKKPMAAYVFYLKACAQKWKAMSQGEKEPYERMAEEDMARYEKDMDQRLE